MLTRQVGEVWTHQGGSRCAMAQEEANVQTQEASESSDTEEEEEARAPSGGDGLHTAYPFPAKMSVEYRGSRLDVIPHLCKKHPHGTRAIVIFFPGVHGGVGPCRRPGQTFDESALYAVLCKRLVEELELEIDCYRCSWPFMRPTMSYAVGAGCRLLYHGLLQASASSGGKSKSVSSERTEGRLRGVSSSSETRLLRVIFIGHSLGGSVALHTAEVVGRHFGVDGIGGMHMNGLENVKVKVSGLCTLNGAVDVDHAKANDMFMSLQGVKGLFVAGDADTVVAPECTEMLCEAFQSSSKRHLVLPGATHDLYTHKEQLVNDLSDFVLDCMTG